MIEGGERKVHRLKGFCSNNFMFYSALSAFLATSTEKFEKFNSYG